MFHPTRTFFPTVCTLLLLVVACGGASKSGSGAAGGAVQVATASASQSLTPVAPALGTAVPQLPGLAAAGSPNPAPQAPALPPTGSPAAASAAPTAAGAPAGISAELANLSKTFTTMKSFRADLTLDSGAQGKQQGSLEVVEPDKFHLTLAGTPAGTIEVISIGTDAYLKVAGTWIKQPNTAGSVPFFDPKQLGSDISDFAQLKVTKAAVVTVAGKSCQSYTWVSNSAPQEACFTSDGLPVRIAVTSSGVTATVVFSSINATIEIKAPI